MLLAFSAVLAMIVFSILFVLVTIILSSLLRPDKPTREKKIVYECGEEPLGSGWVQYNIRFYVIAIIFIIFDVEVIFIYPVAAVFRTMIGEGLGTFVLVELLIFIVILLVGLLYVWMKKDLGWEKTIRSN